MKSADKQTKAYASAGVNVDLASGVRTRIAVAVSLVLASLAAERWVTPLKREFLTPLDEGMVMDMPISVPRMSATKAADDLRAEDAASKDAAQ